MFSKNKTSKSGLDVHQKELFEHAQARIGEKKSLYRHFVLFLAGCILMIVLNLMLGIGSHIRFLDFDWFVLGIVVWSFFLLVHIIRVVLFSKFMGKEWQDKQLKYLVEKQEEKISKMKQKLEQESPTKTLNTGNVILDNTDNEQTLL